MAKKKRISKPAHEEIHSGLVRGALTVIGLATEEQINEFAGTNKTLKSSDRGGKKWLCKCECGNAFLAADRALRYSIVGSCGCKHKTEDITGQRFGRLVAVQRVMDNPWGKPRWMFQCDCGNSIALTVADMKRSEMPSCGCYKTEILKEKITKPGMYRRNLYDIWSHIRMRCNNPNNKAYHNYGGRGIKVCERWNESFENFYNDVIEGYKPGLHLDRIDNDGDYNPENTHWVTPKENARNTRKNRHITTVAGSKTLAEQAEISGVDDSTIHYRLKKGMPEELTIIPHEKGKKYPYEELSQIFDEDAPAVFLDEKTEDEIEKIIKIANTQAFAIKEWGHGADVIILGDEE